MSKNKNTFKKADANGNKLPEEIGKGLNKDHPLNRNPLNSRKEFKINELVLQDFIEYCGGAGKVSKNLREHIDKSLIGFKRK